MFERYYEISDICHGYDGKMITLKKHVPVILPVILGPIDDHKSTALNDTPDMYQEPYTDGDLQHLPGETPLESLKWMGQQP